MNNEAVASDSGAASQVVNSVGAAAAPSSSAADVGSDGTESRQTKVKEKVWHHVYMLYKGQNAQLLSGVEKKPLPPGHEHSGDVVKFSETGKPVAFV